MAVIHCIVLAFNIVSFYASAYTFKTTDKVSIGVFAISIMLLQSFIAVYIIFNCAL